jgi:hypothetical protein
MRRGRGWHSARGDEAHEVFATMICERDRDRHYQQLTGLLDPDQRAVARKASNTCSRSFDAQPHEILHVSPSPRYDLMSAHDLQHIRSRDA